MEVVSSTELGVNLGEDIPEQIRPLLRCNIASYTKGQCLVDDSRVAHDTNGAFK